MRQVFGEITANVALSPTTHILRVRAPEIGAHASAGQFVHVRCTTGADPLLRRPMSIMRAWAKGIAGVAEATGRPIAEGSRDDFALLVEVVGRGTATLAASGEGERLDLLGPLGRGFRLHPKARQILLVGGGVGIAPLLTLATEALAREVAVTILFGARTAAKVFPAGLVPPEVEYVVHTDDGSAGRHGLVTESLADFLRWADQVFACGPEAMLRAVAGEIRARAWGARGSSPPLAQVSLEQRMGCAMGACYGCVVDTVRGRERVCRDGPVFDLFEVDWS